MAHSLKLVKTPSLVVGKGDLEFSVRKDGEKLGEIFISQGGVEWYPRLRSRARSGIKNVDWETFGRIMEAYHNGDLSGY